MLFRSIPVSGSVKGMSGSTVGVRGISSCGKSRLAVKRVRRPTLHRQERMIAQPVLRAPTIVSPTPGTQLVPCRARGLTPEGAGRKPRGFDCAGRAGRARNYAAARPSSFGDAGMLNATSSGERIESGEAKKQRNGRDGRGPGAFAAIVRGRMGRRRDACQSGRGHVRQSALHRRRRSRKPCGRRSFPAARLLRHRLRLGGFRSSYAGRRIGIFSSPALRGNAKTGDAWPAGSPDPRP